MTNGGYICGRRQCATNIFFDSTFIELTEQGIKGHVRIRMTGYYASGIHTSLGFRNQEEKDEYCSERFNRGSNKIKFSNWNITENEDHSEVLITADFDLPDYAKKLADEWYMNLNLYKWYEHQEIDFPKRKMPIEFSFKKHSSYVTALKIPESYKASYIPKSQVFKNDVWGFVMNYSTAPGYVYLTQEFDTDHLMLQYEQFEPWNKVLEQLFPHYKQTISLSKK